MCHFSLLLQSGTFKGVYSFEASQNKLRCNYNTDGNSDNGCSIKTCEKIVSLGLMALHSFHPKRELLKTFQRIVSDSDGLVCIVKTKGELSHCATLQRAQTHTGGQYKLDQFTPSLFLSHMTHQQALNTGLI